MSLSLVIIITALVTTSVFFFVENRKVRNFLLIVSLLNFVLSLINTGYYYSTKTIVDTETVNTKNGSVIIEEVEYKDLIGHVSSSKNVII